MSEEGAARSNRSDTDEFDHYKRRCAELETEVAKLREENEKMREELLALKTTVQAVVARSIDAKADTTRRRFKKPGRRYGHQGSARARPEKVDSTVELDQS